jgi:hypothetical protein
VQLPPNIQRLDTSSRGRQQASGDAGHDKRGLTFLRWRTLHYVPRFLCQKADDTELPTLATGTRHAQIRAHASTVCLSCLVGDLTVLLHVNLPCYLRLVINRYCLSTSSNGHLHGSSAFCPCWLWPYRLCRPASLMPAAPEGLGLNNHKGKVQLAQLSLPAPFITCIRGQDGAAE